MLETKLTDREDQYHQPRLFVHNTELPEEEAKLAFALIERWGMVAGLPDGEDSAGRSKLRLSTPDELVERAFACAKKAFETARESDLMHSTGSSL